MADFIRKQLHDWVKSLESKDVVLICKEKGEATDLCLLIYYLIYIMAWLVFGLYLFQQ
jgi:hypothetical protein